MSQHLHNRIGNAIGEQKRKLFDRLKRDEELEVAVSDFIIEVSNALREIARNLKSTSVKQ